ncbi:MAG TPA: 50S ribosomal protein L5 [Candidatus Micrarchaeota archaeon]|nr:50S ribosomal protein L5 [Candidatus Micrarchaeota archaeon]
MAEKENVMRTLVIEKVTANIGVGNAGESLQNAKILLERLSGKKAVSTKAKTRNPVWKTKKGDEIGAKVTIRGPGAVEFIKKSLVARNKPLSERCFDDSGNFAFGVGEYIDFPGAKYDPKIGIIGYDVAVTMKRKGGKRVSSRRHAKSKIGAKHEITREETVGFAKEVLGANVA